MNRVDMTIPGVDKVGGFSMYSPPGQLRKEGVDPTLDLAIKYSDHPPAKWVHTQVMVPNNSSVTFIFFSYLFDLANSLEIKSLQVKDALQNLKF